MFRGRIVVGSLLMSPLFRKFRSASVIAGVCMILSVATFAQDPRGTIGGRVVDRSDALVVGAKVQVSNVETDVSTTVRTNESGTFRVPFLIPGTYRVTAEMAGFKTASLENIEL